MKKNDLILKIWEVAEIKVSHIYLSNGAKKHYDVVYTETEDIEPNKKYRVIGTLRHKSQTRTFDFDFKVGKEVTISQFINAIFKDVSKVFFDVVDGYVEQIEPNVAKRSLTEDVIRKDVLHHWFYETNYGIGFEIVFLNENIFKAEVKKMSDFLKKYGIIFTNEYSDAHWVYRFKIGLTKEQHLIILKSYLANAKSNPTS